MRRAYVIVGYTSDGKPDVWYAIVHSMARADEVCQEATDEDPVHYYNWKEVIEDDD